MYARNEKEPFDASSYREQSGSTAVRERTSFHETQ